MSSAILYLAIIAIWAMVLVPRWLRHPHAGQQTPDTHDREVVASRQPATTASQDTSSPAARTGPGAAPVTAAAGNTTSHPQPHYPRAGPASPPAPARASLSPTERRARVLRVRRRTLFTLLLLAAGAAALAVAHLAAWWVTAPPGVMLGGFLLLLREAVRIDAQHAALARADWAAPGHGTLTRDRERATQVSPASDRPAAAASAAEATRSAEPAPAAAVPAAGPAADGGAEIIDISARVSDQLYDQYTDAEARAIGD